jgi:hypothetical protein
VAGKIWRRGCRKRSGLSIHKRRRRAPRPQPLSPTVWRPYQGILVGPFIADVTIARRKQPRKLISIRPPIISAASRAKNQTLLKSPPLPGWVHGIWSLRLSPLPMIRTVGTHSEVLTRRALWRRAHHSSVSYLLTTRMIVPSRWLVRPSMSRLFRTPTRPRR